MFDIILTIVLFIFSAVSLIIAVMQFGNKGFLLNNSYIFASENERKNMNKKPYYRQSGIVFTMISIIFAVNAFETIFKTGWLFYIVIAISVIAVVYAVVSSIKIK